jgi:hypothetical protein
MLKRVAGSHQELSKDIVQSSSIKPCIEDECIVLYKGKDTVEERLFDE